MSTGGLDRPGCQFNWLKNRLKNHGDRIEGVRERWLTDLGSRKSPCWWKNKRGMKFFALQSPAVKFRLVFFCFKSWPSVDRFGKHFGGLVILGQIKSVPNFCSFGPQRAEKRTLEGGKCQPKLNSRTLANFGPIKGTFRRLTTIHPIRPVDVSISPR